MKIIQSIMTKNPCYTAGLKINVKGLMLHSVGCPQPSASAFIRNWNKPTYDRACVHAFIDGNTGDVHQTLPWNRRGWHCGSGANNTHIGVEMCEPDCITYTGGATFRVSAEDKPRAVAIAQRTYNSAVELFATLAKQYNLDPLAPGVIISHKEGHALGIASNHGDPEHLWRQLGMPLTMDKFRSDVKKAMNSGTSTGTDTDTSGLTAITGTSKATAVQMAAYLKTVNPTATDAMLSLPSVYLSEGAAEGIRGDIAFAQSMLETGNFKFSGTAVKFLQNNFCGMGVTANGVVGNSFATPQEGIRAQVQHLKAYANSEPLGNAVVDPRYKYVTRGCAPYVEWLGQRENPQGKGWATGAGYGAKILKILDAILTVSAPADETAGKPADNPTMYRVRKTWADAAGQIGAFTNLDNAKKLSDKNPGFRVFDDSGRVVYPVQATPADTSFKVQVTIKNLNIRSGHGTGYSVVPGGYIKPGVYTITEVKAGEGAKAGWGRLKSGVGWISLDFAKKL